MGAPADDLLPLLLGEGPRDALAAVLPRSATLLKTQARWVSYRPGRRVSVRYDGKVEWTNGSTTYEMLVADYNRRGLPDNAARASVGGHEIAVWHAPSDPKLPGMKLAMDTTFARRLLNEIGFDAEAVRLSAAVYRPGARAVIHAEADLGPAAQPRTASLYLKVMGEAEAKRIAEVHRRFEGVLPIARCHHAGSGVLVLEGLPGATLGSRLRGGHPVPSAEEVLDLTGRLASVPLPGEASDEAGRSLRAHCGLLRAVIPEAADRIDRIEPLLTPREDQPVETIHGDFHEGQMLVEEGKLAGLLDIDDAGPGHRVDDVALIAGRVWVSAQEREDPAIQAYADGLLRHGGTIVDSGELRRRAGISLLGRVTGPFRNQLREWRTRSLQRLEIVERWVEAELL